MDEEPKTYGQNGFGRFRELIIHPTVFGVAAALITGFVLTGLVAIQADGAETVEAALGEIKNGISRWAGWFFILDVNLFLLFVVGLAISPLGRIRLGGREAKPEFSTWSWVAMLFSAGMGIGLVFWSVAEPIYHFSDPPRPVDDEIAAARQAMNLTFFHWGLHAWGVYALVGLSLAFFCFNRGLPLTIRSAFQPVLGKHIDGPIGSAIDITAVVATLFGVATSLGLGVSQIAAGLSTVFGLSANDTMLILLIAVITAMATASVVLGLDGGIRRLSEANLVAAGLLLLFVLLVGPTVVLLNAFVQNTGSYLQSLPATATWTGTYRGTDWLSSWTVFYWAWWIAWSPFVGMFIARISKGRTIREFLVGVLGAPVLLTFFWLTVFGNSALDQELTQSGGLVEAVSANYATALFDLLGRFPMETLTSLLAIVVIVVFFVTSSDSGSLVIDIITAGGHTDPPVPQRIFWAVAEGVVAAVLLVGGGLQALQTASILTGLPFAIILLIMAYSLFKGLRQEQCGQGRPSRSE